MAIGYALLAQELTINGSASIDSTWKVEITNIESKDVVGDAVNKVDPSYTATTANFSVGFTQPGDSITYDITVTNKGTLDAVVESINVVKGDNQAITYTTSGLKRGDKLAKNNGTNTLTVKVDYDSNVTSQPASTTNDITVTINYQQDLGQVPAYEAYSVGDTIEFAGSNWKVIKNSNGNEDYVTLMKETVLTGNELEEYAYTFTCGSYQVYNNSNGCTYIGEVIALNKMDYTWTETCHNANHGYTSEDKSDCSNTNDYNSSKIKTFLEQNYMFKLGTNNLKEVNGYKIRLITLDELFELGYNNEFNGTNVYGCDKSITPSWVYQNYQGNDTELAGYWTMTSANDIANWYQQDHVLYVGGQGIVDDYHVFRINGGGVRPVINLLKTSIE